MSEPIRLAHVRPLAEGERRVVWVGRREILLFSRDGCLLGIDNACPHQGKPLVDGQLSGEEVVCAWHGWHVRLEDGHCRERPGCPHRTYRVVPDGDGIRIEV